MARRTARVLRLLLALLLALGTLATLPPVRVGAVACPVTNPADSGANTLRARVADATCDVITFSLPGSGPWTINLTSPLPAINRTLTVTGPSRDRLTLDGGNAIRPLGIIGGTVTISGLTVARGRVTAADGNGAYGGCVNIGNGTITLRDLRVRDCVAQNQGGGGITIAGGTTLIERVELRNNRADAESGFGGGGGGLFVDQYSGPTTVTIRDSVIAGNQVLNGGLGGGIRTIRLPDRPGGGAAPYPLTVAIERSTVGGPTPADANSAAYGGGLFNGSAAVILADTTVSGNTTTIHGGGLYNQFGTATLTNTTISGNSATNSGGGLYNDRGTATLTNATLVGNTATSAGPGIHIGGIHTYAPAVSDFAKTFLKQSIVVGNSRQDCITEIYYASNISQGHNVVGSGCPADGDGDLRYGDPLVALLDPTLRDNGGATPTHGLTPGSPALNRVPLAACASATDQRGAPRPQPVNGMCDSGAVEGLTRRNLTVATSGNGAVDRSPAGTGGGPFTYDLHSPVTLTPQPGAGQTFVGWVVDGVNRGWASPLTLTMDAAHTVRAIFAPTTTFPNVGNGRADYAAIVALASRGTIRGYANGTYGPNDGVQRAQMAALIARATPAGPGTPTNGTLTPPACLAAGTWDCEDWGSAFSDQGGLDANLWRNVGTLQHYGAARGYDGAACATRGVPSPCFAPTAPVSYVETIAFITRAMIAKGYWQAQPNAPVPYTGVPGVFAPEVATFHFYAQAVGGVPAPLADWNAGATRGWFALALWAALHSYWGADGTLPDGRPAGGMVP